MNIVIVGAGEIGSYLAKDFARQSHHITVIESHPKIANELEQSIDAKVICGRGESVSDLAMANIGECELFLALTSENTVNLMSGSMAKTLGAAKVISRVHPGLQREEWLFDYRGHFGIDHLFSSERLAALELAKFIRNPSSMVVEELARGKIELQQIKVGDQSPALGKSLKDLKTPEHIRVAMISRKAEHFVPNAESYIRKGDVLTLFGEPRKLRKFTKKLQKGNASSEEMRVIIFGGGEYGLALAQMLENTDCRVRIFEKDPVRCELLAEELSRTAVINADATVIAELEDEQVGQADFFVATSQSDEDNVMTCLQANMMGVKNCLTLIHRTDYARAISASGRHFGVIAAISPREATRREIERFITSDPYHLVKRLSGGNLIETEILLGSAVAGHMLKEIEWPESTVLVGLMRGLKAWVPGPDDVLESGDQIYVVIAPSSLRDLLKLVH